MTVIKDIRFWGLLVVIAATALAIFVAPQTGRANPSTIQRFSTSGSSSVATTTVSYMTAGTATTTLVFDSAVGASTAMDSAALGVQFIGSSTSSTLNTALEYSPGVANVNCVTTPNACDWYSDGLYGNYFATTTQPISLATLNSFSLPFASSTVGGAVGPGNGRITRIFNVPMPMRYVRAVFTLPAGSLNGAVYAEFDGKKQNP